MQRLAWWVMREDQWLLFHLSSISKTFPVFSGVSFGSVLRPTGLQSSMRTGQWDKLYHQQACRYHQIGKASWYARVQAALQRTLTSCPVGKWEPHEVCLSKGKVLSRMEKPHATVNTRRYLGRKISAKDQRSCGTNQHHALKVKKCQLHPGLHEQ